jgi:hypothetical protein
MRAAVGLLTLTAVLMACASTNWKPVEQPYQEAVEHPWSSPVRVTRLGGQQLTLYRAVVKADSVVGFKRQRPPAGRTSIALADIHRIQSPHTSTVAGLLLLAGLAGGTVLVAYWMTGCGGSELC